MRRPLALPHAPRRLLPATAVAVALALAFAMTGCLEIADDATPPTLPGAPLTPTPASSAPTIALPTVVPTPPDCDAVVTMDGFAFQPSRIEVEAGGVVCWANRDAVVHAVAFDDGTYLSGDIALGATASATLTVGAHRYHCARHPWMNATLIVHAAPPAPVPTPPTEPQPTPAEPTPVPSMPTPTPTPTPAPQAVWSVEGVTMPARATVGEPVTIAGDLANRGTADGTTRLSLWGNGGMSQDAPFSVAARANSPFSFTFTPVSVGTFAIELRLPDGSVLDRRTLTVDPIPTPTPTPTPTPSPTAPTTASVAIQGFAFQPASVTIAAGGSVTFTNHDGAPHSATADDGSWDTGTLGNGQGATIAFPTARTSPYHCKFHPSMTGTVTVT